MKNQIKIINTSKIIKIIAWLWIIGGIGKLSMSVLSFSQFELWRNFFLFFLKLSCILSGFLLLRGLRQGAIIYFCVTLINTCMFYYFPPKIENIEYYFTPIAIVGSIVFPLIFLIIILTQWKKLRYKNP